MAERVFLHVGTPKSGTTYLQDLLWSNREVLARDGVAYPGWAPDAHFRACLDLLDLRFDDWHGPATVGTWDRLVAEVAQTGGRGGDQPRALR
ncbi:hypothetical protein DQ237_02390 [Blastococcus sp. TF02-8]|uniref:hypothetical protein n=1 Tax=Blastococcus sp. TF02-8 TaxID=2250574 RepID=UPI000DEBF330|nr:hypothetical protein [Blastococcus sp. TF02-8]RBY97782.1 hypothetical protein DQ237_02390 [Blastococcus sp. TF02-8]